MWPFSKKFETEEEVDTWFAEQKAALLKAYDDNSTSPNAEKQYKAKTARLRAEYTKYMEAILAPKKKPFFGKH